LRRASEPHKVAYSRRDAKGAQESSGDKGCNSA